MKTATLITFATLVTAAMLFAPFRGPDPFKPATLAGVYRDLFAQMPARWTGEHAGFLLIVIVGGVATLSPVALALCRASRPATFTLAAVASLGAIANAFLILLSQTSFAFGGSPLPGATVAFAWGVAIVQLAVAIAAVVVACGARAAVA